MITRKIVGITILVVCALLPLIVFYIVAFIKAIKDVIKYGDFSGLLALLWATVALAGLGLVMF